MPTTRCRSTPALSGQEGRCSNQGLNGHKWKGTMFRIVSLVLVAGVALAGCQTVNRALSYDQKVH